MDLLRLPSGLRTSLSGHVRALCATTRSLSSRPQAASGPAPSPPSLSNPTHPLNDYSTSNPPNVAQLRYASRFFQVDDPNLLYSAFHFRSFPPSSHPEVAFLGRSNVGKSSILNALFGFSKLEAAYISKQVGKTRTMNGFGIGGEGMGKAPPEERKNDVWKRFGRGGLVLVDMPGYGGGSRKEWGEEALKYLTQRKQLRRTFLLVDPEHGIKDSDIALLTHLRQEGVPFTVVMSKADKLLYPGSKLPSQHKVNKGMARLSKVRQDVRKKLKVAFGEGRDYEDDILCVSARKSLDERSGYRSKIGIDELRWAVLSACGLESDEKGFAKRKIRAEDVLQEPKEILTTEDALGPL